MSPLLALAFAAGMLAPVNPCGFALLPAWITYSLGDADTSPLPVRLARALRAGVVLTVGFAGALVAAGLAISAGARALITAAPWLGLAIGITLVVLGAAMLAGLPVRLRLRPATTRSTQPTRGSSTGVGRLALFGVGYAVASLSCTFGVLLAVIAQAQATASYAGLLLVFAAYATGAATLLVLVALATAAAGAALTRRITALARYGPRITATVLILTGAYLAWYWYPAATSGTTSGSGLARFSATATTWISAHTGTITVLAAAAILTVTAIAVGHRLRRRAATGADPDSAA
ncbi:cytochrome c biogenesis CcdA family protein [Amycolatopsis thermoflava]|uniref:cytochrome c biogenesis CcdA family protein n=1 Tax=Amycolatopsis thermoflava TaxID=84480 RepID=UPI00365C1A9E